MKRRSFADLVLINWPIKVLSLSIAVVLFFLYKLATQEERFFNIPLSLVVHDEYIPAGNYPKKVRITLKGQEKDIFLVMDEDIEAIADLSEYSSEGIYKASVQVHKTGNALNLQNLEIRVDPMTITVALERKIKKSLEIFPSIKGTPADGFSLRQFIISPTYVEAEGPRSELQDLTTIRTEDIDLSNKTDTFTVRVRLDYDETKMSFPGGQIVEFTAIIEGSIVLRNFQNVEIVWRDLPQGLALTTPRSFGSLQLQGNQTILQAFGSGDLKLFADCSDIKKPGEYTVPIEPDDSDNVAVMNYAPRTLLVQVIASEE